MGSTLTMLVSSVVSACTRLPTVTSSRLIRPLIGEVTCVKVKFNVPTRPRPGLPEPSPLPDSCSRLPYRSPLWQSLPSAGACPDGQNSRPGAVGSLRPPVVGLWLDRELPGRAADR